MESTEDQRVLQAEHARFDTGPLSPSPWRRLFPHDLWSGSPLAAIEACLDSSQVRAKIDACEQDERYPSDVLDELRAAGIAEFLTESDPRAPAATSTLTAPHFAALNATTARRNGSVAISIGVNALALLPAWIGANNEQLDHLFKKVREGAFGAMLLTEAAHGSNLLRNETRAAAGTLDRAGNFVEIRDVAPAAVQTEATHYRVRGSKHMINGGREHDLLFTLVRTSDPVDPESAFSSIGCFSLIWIERGPGVHGLHRWKTLPAQAADISGVHFEDVIVPIDHRLGREGSGFSLVRRTLSISRGSVASLASGALTGAHDLAVAYAQRRNVYGTSIASSLAPIRDHLISLRTLDWVVAALAVKAAAVSNHHGLSAGHYTAIAKLICCDLAEEGVREGARVVGGRALLRSLAYERVGRDVKLYGVFDGTSHIMQEEIVGRLREESQRRAGKRETRITDPLMEMREVYGRAPRSAIESLRDTRPRSWVVPLPEYFEALASIDSDLPLGALATITDLLYALYHGLPKGEAADVSDEHHAAWTMGLLESIVAVVELGSPEHRQALGMPPVDDEGAVDRLKTRFGVKWLGGRAAARVRELAGRSGVTISLSSLCSAESELREGLASDRKSLHQALADS